MVQRVEQRTDDDERDHLVATEGLLRSSSSDVITMESFMVMMLNIGSLSPFVTRLPAALAAKRRTWKARGSELAHCHCLSTTRNVVEGRQPNDRRKAGAPVAGHRDPPCATGPAATNRWFHRNLPMCRTFLAEWRQSIFGRQHQPFAMVGGSMVMARCVPSSGAARQRSALAVQVCGPHVAARPGRRERLQPGAARYVCRRSGCMVRRLQRNLHLCNNLLRVSVNQLEGCNQFVGGEGC